MNKGDLLPHIGDTPDIMGEIARGLSEHYDDLLMRMNAVEQSDIRSKLMHVIHNLCAKFSTSATVSFHGMGLNLTHQDLADMIGSTREAVSIEMAKLRADGLVDYSRSTFVVHAETLAGHIDAPA
jgi:CRP/FNR family transcriptional regulator